MEIKTLLYVDDKVYLAIRINDVTYPLEVKLVETSEYVTKKCVAFNEGTLLDLDNVFTRTVAEVMFISEFIKQRKDYSELLTDVINKTADIVVAKNANNVLHREIEVQSVLDGKVVADTLVAGNVFKLDDGRWGIGKLPKHTDEVDELASLEIAKLRQEIDELKRELEEQIDFKVKAIQDNIRLEVKLSHLTNNKL